MSDHGLLLLLVLNLSDPCACCSLSHLWFLFSCLAFSLSFGSKFFSVRNLHKMLEDIRFSSFYCRCRVCLHGSVVRSIDSFI